MFSPAELMLREQYGSPEQQRETVTFGMWIFLATEVLFFGALFAAFTIYRMYYPRGFDEGSAVMNIVLGAINTAVLITSSLTMALSIYSIALGKTMRTYVLLLTTALIGLIFLAIKFTEYYQHYQAHKAPGVWFESNSPHAGAMQLFYVFYFAMTGLHALHMTIGITLVVLFAFRTAAGSFNAEYHTPLEALGLYWHFVDIVWVFLFGIFYISGLHK
ncbi:MAG: cytochrome c oxidase subunit 3 [Bryobacteraceae bacterium]